MTTGQINTLKKGLNGELIYLQDTVNTGKTERRIDTYIEKLEKEGYVVKSPKHVLHTGHSYFYLLTKKGEQAAK